MVSKRSGGFLYRLSTAILGQTDSFAIARIFAQHVIKFSKLETAVLIWPETSESFTTPLRTETLGRRPSRSSSKVTSARFKERDSIFFRIEFYAERKIKLSSQFRGEFRQAVKLVSEAIRHNEARLRDEELHRFHWMRRLTAGLSHELNTPLTTLLYHAKKISQGGTLNPSAPEQIRTSMNALSDVLRQYQVLSGDGQFVEFESVAVADLAESLKARVHEKFPRFTSWFRFNIDVSLGYVEIHAPDIERLLLSILENAVHAVQQSRLELNEEPAIEVTFRRHKTAYEIVITDNGPGIKTEDRPFIFAPFFSTKEVGEGSGLGLSVARAIAFLNNGSLRLNPLSQRTQFILELPFSKSQTVPRSAA